MVRFFIGITHYDFIKKVMNLMMDQLQENAFKRFHLNIVIMWVMFMIAIFFYGGLIFLWEKKIFLLPPIEGIKEDMKNTFVISFAFLSVIQLLAGAFLERTLSAAEKIVKNIKSNPQMNSIARSLAGAFTINMVFRETIAVYGLGMYMMFHSIDVFYCFSVPALLLILMRYPSFNSWKEKAELVLRHMPDARLL